MKTSIAVRRVLVAAMLAIALPLAWLGSLDRLAEEYVESGLKRALVTFAVARTANAIISALQETTVAISPMGVGVTASPGQVLDPLNDLIEQFSNLMLAACVSLAIQRLLIEIGGYPAVSAGLTIALLAWAWLALRDQRSPPWLLRVLVVLLFVRFAVPLAALGSEAAFRAALSNEYADAQAQVDLTSRAMTQTAPDLDAGKAEGPLERWFSDRKRDLKTDFTELRNKAENAIRHIITLMAVFAVQTVVLPVLFLWLIYRLFAATFNRWAPLAPYGAPQGAR